MAHLIQIALAVKEGAGCGIHLPRSFPTRLIVFAEPVYQIKLVNMKKEQIEVEIHVTYYASKNNLSAQRTFKVETSRALLFRSLDAIERKLTKLYPTNDKGNTTDSTMGDVASVRTGDSVDSKPLAL